MCVCVCVCTVGFDTILYTISNIKFCILMFVYVYVCYLNHSAGYHSVYHFTLSFLLIFNVYNII